MNGQKQGGDCFHFVPGILIPLDVSRGHTQALHCKPMKCQTLTVQTGMPPIWRVVYRRCVWREPSTVSGSFFQWHKVSPCVCQAATAATAAMMMVACPKLLILLVVCTALLQQGDSRPSRSRKAAPGRRRGNTQHMVEVGQIHYIKDRCGY